MWKGHLEVEHTLINAHTLHISEHTLLPLVRDHERPAHTATVYKDVAKNAHFCPSKDYEAFVADGGDLQKAKYHNNAISPYFEIPLDQVGTVLLLKVTIPTSVTRTGHPPWTPY